MNTTIQTIIAHHAIDKLPGLLGHMPGAVLLVADNITYPIAGEYAAKVLQKTGIPCCECILRRRAPLVPDEEAVAEIEAANSPEIETFLSVGSGAITDLTRYVSGKAGKPFIAIATAPSMDGYASPVAPLTLNGLKQTLPAAPPRVLIADPDILAAAPPRMIQAGLGDLLGKYTSLADWKLGELVDGELFSSEIEVSVRLAVDQAIMSFEGEVDRSGQVKKLLQALIISGEAMLAWGNSRPASGAEHHLAHYWEMEALQAKREIHLHGIKVGVATVLVTEFYQKIFGLNRQEVEALIAHFQAETDEEYQERLRAGYRGLVSDVMHELKGYYRDPERRKERQRRILTRWSELQTWVREKMPAPERIKAILRQVGAPVMSREIGVSDAALALALQNAKEIRGRYTVFRLAEDLGLSLEDLK